MRMDNAEGERAKERGKTDVLRKRCDHCPLPPLSKAGCCCDRTRLRETGGQCYSCLHALHRFPTVAFPDKACPCRRSNSNSTIMILATFKLKSF